VRSFKQNL
jgi:hypothetical protein